MTKRYQDIYPSSPLQRSSETVRPSATELLTLEYFEAEPSSMPTHVFSQHHILVNLNETPHRVENWRDGVHRDFTYSLNEIIVTPAGVESGWRWHIRSKVIVITLEPKKLEHFAQNELGILLTKAQLENIPQFVDADITQAAVMMQDALNSKLGSAVMFESLARVFLIKLIQKYGVEQTEDYAFSQSFTSQHYQRVLEFIANRFGESITLEDIAKQAGLSGFHFTRLFKQTIGQTPHQFLMAYRVEQSKQMLTDRSLPLIDIALRCGFADQPHFSRVFKRSEGITPKQFRAQQE